MNKHERDKLNKPVPARVSPSLHTQEADMESNETSLQSIQEQHHHQEQPSITLRNPPQTWKIPQIERKNLPKNAAATRTRDGI